ncbi:MAG: helix-turn-helix domain-containing protein, partial [Methyloceanibacter sp.]
MPAGYDAEVAELFRDLRSASGLSEADLAAQLATRPEVVQALEQGALYALPPWPETYRVVATYGTLLNLDVRPLLRRIYAQVDAGVVGLAPKSMPDVPFMAPPESIGREFQGQAPVSAPRAPHAAPNRQPPARQAQAPQSRPQPQQNSQPLPQQQPQW